MGKNDLYQKSLLDVKRYLVKETAISAENERFLLEKVF